MLTLGFRDANRAQSCGEGNALINQFRFEVTAYHQELAARLALATIERNADSIETGLAEVAAAGVSTALAVLIVQSRNLAAAMIVLQGIEDARRFLQRTIFDAEVDPDG
ncbi:MAG: hypothetical protein JOZ49_02970 [Mycolicibacterium sp.]|nr:hypothetical protein [Mycolicibacterium sp.]